MIQKSLQKSISSNRQLDFTSQISISYLDVNNQQPNCEIVDFIKILDMNQDTNQCFGLVCAIDKRDKLFKSISQNYKVALSWYFPLSKEKYIIQAETMFHSKTNNNANIQQPKKHENDQHCRLATKIKCVEEQLENTIVDVWNGLSQTQKKQYVRPQPDLDLQTMQEKFNTPDISNIASNLVIMLLLPYYGTLNIKILVEHTVYHMPQVVADSRTKFESIFMPYKKNRKYVHQLDSLQWNIKEVNP